MRIQKCSDGQILILRSNDIYPAVNPALIPVINGIGSLRMRPGTVRTPDMVIGIIAPMIHAPSIFEDFEHYEDGLNLLVRGWSGYGRAFICTNRRLHLSSQLPKLGTKTHVLGESEDVIIGDFDVNSPGALKLFKRTLWDHQAQLVQ